MKDYVQVVRCINCKHCRVLNYEGVYAICLKHTYKFQPFEVDVREHYCSFGERRDEERCI